MNVAALAALQSWPPPCGDNNGLLLAGAPTKTNLRACFGLWIRRPLVGAASSPRFSGRCRDHGIGPRTTLLQGRAGARGRGRANRQSRRRREVGAPPSGRWWCTPATIAAGAPLPRVVVLAGAPAGAGRRPLKRRQPRPAARPGAALHQQAVAKHPTSSRIPWHLRPPSPLELYANHSNCAAYAPGSEVHTIKPVIRCFLDCAYYQC